MRDPGEVAIDAARAAGPVLLRHFGRLSTVEHKGAGDLVTLADREAETTIVAVLRAAYPDHRIVAEESGHHAGAADYVWYVDPLDGTTNFVHCFPHFAVSVALLAHGTLVAAAVYDPLRRETFHARRSAGSFLDGRPVRASSVDRLAGALVGTGFPYDCHSSMAEHLPAFDRVVRRAQGVRRAGSAALDLCYVACGRLDGYWERGLKPWDTAAGTLLVEEAGGMVTNHAGEHPVIPHQDVVATNGRLHDELRAAVAGQPP